MAHTFTTKWPFKRVTAQEEFYCKNTNLYKHRVHLYVDCDLKLKNNVHRVHEYLSSISIYPVQFCCVVDSL